MRNYRVIFQPNKTETQLNVYSTYKDTDMKYRELLSLGYGRILVLMDGSVLHRVNN